MSHSKEISYQDIIKSKTESLNCIVKMAMRLFQSSKSLLILDKEEGYILKSYFGFNNLEQEINFSFLEKSFRGQKEVVTQKKDTNFFFGIPLIDTKQKFQGTLCFVSESDDFINKDDNELIEEVSTIIVNIIEREVEYRKLFFLKKQYEAVQSMSKTGGWELDIKTNKTVWSKEVYKIHKLAIGKSPDKFDAISFYAEHDRERLIKCIEEAISDLKPFDEVFEFVDNEGNEKWIRTMGTPIINEGGVVEKLVGTFKDITENKKHELSIVEKNIAIHEVNDYLDLALEGSGLGIWDWNLVDESVRFDKRWVEMLGGNVETFKMELKSWEERVHPDDLEECYKDINNYINGKTEFYENIHRMKHEDGHWVYILDRGRISGRDKNGKPIRFTGTHLDITESRSRELELSLILREAGLGIWKFYPKTGELFWDKSLYKLYNVSEDDFSGAYEAWEKTLAPEDKEIAVKKLEDALAGKASFESKFTIITGSGERKVIGAKADIERDHNGEAILMTGINWDITKEHEISTELEKQASFLKRTLDSLPALFYSKDEDGRYIMVNKAYLKTFSWTESDIIGKKDHEIFPQDFADAFIENDLKIIENLSIIECQETAINSNGEEKKYHSFKFPYLNKEGELYATGGISLDITEKLEMEQMIGHNAKLASIGELAAGVGHEINNPLTIIKAYVTAIMKDGHNVDDVVINQLSKVSLAADRIANIVSGLRRFARAGDTSENISFNIKDVLSEIRGMLQEIYVQEGVDLVFNMDNLNDNSQLNGDQGKLEQILVNLISNAKDATEGQKLREIEVTVKNDSESLLIRVRDNGKGIAKNVIDKIYDPFYTTKNIGDGTGIGLSLVHKFIHNEFKGEVDIETAENEGTSFVVKIPNVFLKDINLQKSKVHDDKEILLHVAPLSVMVVDDEEGIREFLEDLLEDLGFHVTSFSNGKTAFECYLERANEFDLIISDMQMAEMDGPTLLNNIREHSHLNQPLFMFITGGVNVDLNDKNNKLVQLSSGFLYKPFCEDTITKKLNEILKNDKDKKIA